MVRKDEFVEKSNFAQLYTAIIDFEDILAKTDDLKDEVNTLDYILYKYIIKN